MFIFCYVFVMPPPSCITADRNECADPSLNNCASNAMCINSPGGFLCSCPLGFIGDPTVDCQGEKQLEDKLNVLPVNHV